LSASIFQDETNKLSTPLDRRPVVELIAHFLQGIVG
jgi:hypothetical protein